MNPTQQPAPATPRILLGFVLALLSGCSSTNGWIANRQGMSYYKQGNYTAARQEFQRAAIDNPNSADYQHNLAMAMHKQGDSFNAEQSLRRALTIDPSHQPSYHSLASVMKDQGRGQEAVALLDNWSQTQPYSSTAQVETAWVHRETGDVAGAEQSLRQALRLQPNNSTALAHLGQIYQDTGRHSEAVAFYQKSLASNYNQPQVHSRLAAMRPVQAYRADERLAATPRPMTTQFAYGAPYMSSAPMMAQSYYPATPMTAWNGMSSPTYAPMASQPVQIGVPMTANADPAHVHEATAGLPEVQPY